MFNNQVMFDRLNATKICLNLLWEENDHYSQYMKILLKFITTLLKGGNHSVQKTLFDFFLTNSSCEKFFKKIFDIITDYIESHIDRSHEKTRDEDKVIKKVLRLLQLFCEGHNHLLQSYLIHQNQSKLNYNLVNLTVELLLSFKIHDNNFNIVQQCFETLTEYIQVSFIKYFLIFFILF